MAFSSETRPPPTHIAPSLKRPTFKMLKAITCPLPISPSRFSAGTLQSLRMMGHVDDPRMPILCSSAPTEKPGKFLSTRNALNFSPLILAKTVNRSAKPALVIHIFSPLRLECLPSDESSARARQLSASEPDEASDKAYAPTISPEANRGRYLFFCASVPKDKNART